MIEEGGGKYAERRFVGKQRAVFLASGGMTLV